MDKLIDWLDGRIVYYSKVLLTATWFSVFVCTPLIALAFIFSILLHNADVQMRVYFALSIANVFIGTPLVFRVWFGYWPFYTKWKRRKQIRQMKFYDPNLPPKQ